MKGNVVGMDVFVMLIVGERVRLNVVVIVLVNGNVVGIPLYDIDCVTDLVKGNVVGIGVIVMLIVGEAERLNVVVIVLVNGYVVGIPL